MKLLARNLLSKTLSKAQTAKGGLFDARKRLRIPPEARGSLDVFLPQAPTARHQKRKAHALKRVALGEAAFYAAWLVSKALGPDAAESIAHQTPSAAIKVIETCQSSLGGWAGQAAQALPFRLPPAPGVLPGIGSIDEVVLRAPSKISILGDNFAASTFSGLNMAQINEQLEPRLEGLVADCLGPELASQVQIRKLQDSLHELYVSTPQSRYERVGLVHQRFDPPQRTVEETVHYFPDGSDTAIPNDRQAADTVLLEQETVLQAGASPVEVDLSTLPPNMPVTSQEGVPLNRVFKLPEQEIALELLDGRQPRGVENIHQVVIRTSLNAPATSAQEAAERTGLPSSDLSRLAIGGGAAKWSREPMNDTTGFIMEFTDTKGTRYLAFIAPETHPLPGAS